MKAIPLKEVKTSDVIEFIKYHVIYRFGIPDEFFTIMDLNSSVRHSRNSAINSKFRVYPQQHTIQPPMVLQKPSTRLLKNFSRSSSQKVNATGTRS